MTERTVVNNADYDFLMTKKGNYYIGHDKDNHACFGFANHDASQRGTVLITKNIVLEYSAKICDIDGKPTDLSLVILSYRGNDVENEKTFIEICELYLSDEKNHDRKQITNIFYMLSKFFNTHEEYSDRELQGLFAELYTIYSYKDEIDLAKYWQSKEMMNFDFSFSDKNKLEIKSTIKSDRRHHFKHEQLSTELYNISVLSYMLKDDDCGLSLYDLIQESMSLMSKYPEKVYKLKKVLHDVEESRLKSIRYDETYLLKHRKLFDAFDIPRFNEETPEGVANAEYDCLLEDVKGLSDTMIIKRLKEITPKE